MLKLFFLWALATTLGELIGFAIPSVLGVIAVIFAPKLLFAMMILAGVGEGAVLGFAQSLVLKRYLKNISQPQWIFATAAAAALAWIIGMLPSTLIDNNVILSPTIIITGGILLAILFLLSMGFAQWLVLRKQVKKAGWWILANAIAWPLGVATSIGILALVPDQSSTIVWITVGILSGVMMGAVVGVITGIALVRLTPKP